MALFGSAVPESLGITSRLCRPNQMTRLGAPRLLPAPAGVSRSKVTAPICGPLTAGVSHCGGQLGQRHEVGTGVSVVVRPALWSSSGLLGLLVP